jgi:ABC-type Mn2+/Zn2+ transport system permease subunit
VARVPAVDREAAVGVVVTTLFGLGALLALTPDSPPGIQEILFGDVLGPTDGDLAAAAALVVIVAATLLLLHGRLLAGGFDRRAAGSLGAAPARTEAALLVLLALAVVVAVQGLGNLLVVAVFVGPAATARRLTERIGPMIALSVADALLCGAAGLYLSYYAGTAAGASVALAVVAAYLLSVPAGRLLSLRGSGESHAAEATIA